MHYRFIRGDVWSLILMPLLPAVFCEDDPGIVQRTFKVRMQHCHMTQTDPTLPCKYGVKQNEVKLVLQNI